MPNYKISLLHGMILLYNLYITRDKDLDADHLFNELVRKVDSIEFSIPREVLESVLAYANFNSEDGIFWHPNEANFETFALSLLKNGDKFDKFYNLIEGKNG